MDGTKKHILITGLPGTGKTTLIKKLSDMLKNLSPAGFFTTEIREAGIRKGFEIVSLSGKKGILSHVDIKSLYRVGKYGVDVKSFDDFLDSVLFFNPATNLIIIDEIGKMECFSRKFIDIIKKILDSDKLLIATISLKGSGFIAKIRQRNDIMLFEVTQGNRDILAADVSKKIKEILPPSLIE